jgi:hypothetical protein
MNTSRKVKKRNEILKSEFSPFTPFFLAKKSHKILHFFFTIMGQNLFFIYPLFAGNPNPIPLDLPIALFSLFSLAVLSRQFVLSILW